MTDVRTQSGMESVFITDWTDWELLEVGHLIFYGGVFSDDIRNRVGVDKGDISIDMQSGQICVFNVDGEELMTAPIKFTITE